MKLNRSPLSVALIALAICAVLGLVVFIAFGDHSNSIHRSEANETFGQILGGWSVVVATVAYFVQRRRVNAQWDDSINSSAGASDQGIR